MTLPAVLPGVPPVVVAEPNTAEIARLRALVEADAEAAALSAATAEAAAGPTYANTGAGLAATSDGEGFAVDNGDGTVTVYINDGGAAVSQRTLATTDYVASTYAAITDLALPSVADYGAITPSVTAKSTLEDAFADVGRGGMLGATTEIDIGSTAAEDPGVEFRGEKGIYYEGATGGRRLMNKPGRDVSLPQWGRENLVRWLEGLRAGETLKVALVGDSNTEGYVGAALKTYLDSLPNVSVTNYGVSGSQVEEWRAGTAPYDSNGKAMSNVIAYDPDLIVMCWGTNDPGDGRDADDFATSLEAALTTLRASLDNNACSIALLTPNAMSRTDGRDELWSLQIRPIIRAMAERFTCGFFDKNAVFPNTATDLASGAMQNKFFDSERAHTATLATNIIAAYLAEWLVPRELWKLTWDNLGNKSEADTPATYPPGMSIGFLSGGSPPFTSSPFVVFNPISTGGHFPMQIAWAFNGTDYRIAFRVAVGSAWRAWNYVGPDSLKVLTSLASGYSLAGGAAGLNTQRDGNIVSLSGALTRSAGAIASGTALGVIDSAHRPIFNIQDAVAVATNAGGTVERLRADVLTTGSVIVRESSVMSDATKVAINLTYRGA